jgi:hypothetical protein
VIGALDLLDHVSVSSPQPARNQYPVRSTDNGTSQQQIKTGLAYSWYMEICGDGTHPYTACSNMNGPFFTPPETEGQTWKAFEAAQRLPAEPSEMACNAKNWIMYSGNWRDGPCALNPKPVR